MSQNIGGMAPYMNSMGGPRGQSPMYYPPCPGGPMETPHPHMVRPPPFFHDDKINHCGSAAAMSQQHMRFRMGMGEFKPPMVGVVEPPPVAPAPAKKKRRANNSVNNSVNHHPPPQPPSIQDLAPPPPSGYGDTIVASNPFDDSPPPHTMMVRHMGCGGVVSGGGMMGGPCGMGSPMGGCGGRSPMGGPMLCGTPPMHRASPLVAADCMAPRKGSPMMGPGPSCISPIHSPNGPVCSNGPPLDPSSCNGPQRGPLHGGPPQGPPMPPGGPPPPPPHHPMHQHHHLHHPPAPPQPPYHHPHHPPTKPMPVSAGKIYPVDQPMVFNPQNPNAPPIYPCGVCHKEVHDNDQAILCESGCNFWFHRVCTGLTEGAFQLLTAEVYAEWACDKCLNTKNIPLVKLKP